MDVQDPPVTAGCTAAQIRDCARQIIGTCCPSARLETFLLLQSNEKAGFDTAWSWRAVSIWQKNQAPVRVSAQTLEHVAPAPCTSVLDTTNSPKQSLASMSVVKCEVWGKVSYNSLNITVLARIKCFTHATQVR